MNTARRSRVAVELVGSLGSFGEGMGLRRVSDSITHLPFLMPQKSQAKDCDSERDNTVRLEGVACRAWTA